MSNCIDYDSLENFVNCLNNVLNDYYIELCEHIDKGYLTHADCVYLELIKREYLRIKAKKRGKLFLFGGF